MNKSMCLYSTMDKCTEKQTRDTENKSKQVTNINTISVPTHTKRSKIRLKETKMILFFMRCSSRCRQWANYHYGWLTYTFWLFIKFFFLSVSFSTTFGIVCHSFVNVYHAFIRNSYKYAHMMVNERHRNGVGRYHAREVKNWWVAQAVKKK